MCRKSSVISVPVWFALLLLLGAESARSAEFSPIRIGFDGYHKVGRYTPVMIETGNSATTSCEVVVVDPDGVRIARPLSPHPENTSGTKRWLGVVRPGQLDAQFEFFAKDDSGKTERFRVSAAENKTAGSEIRSLRQSTSLWLEVGMSAELMTSLTSIESVRSKVWPDMADLAWSLDGIDGILVSSQVELSESARTELVRWLRAGGHLVVSLATDAEEFQASPWGPLVKDVVEIRERTRTSDLSGIESFTGQARKITGGNRTLVTTLAPLQGRALVSCLEGALATRASIGFGQVTVVGIDVTVPPISRWDGRMAFLKRLLFRQENPAITKLTEDTRLSQSGITDLASQWRAAAIQVSGVNRSTVWEVLGLLLVYGVIIGPLDYLLVHRLLKRPHWTWTTLPLCVAIASVVTIWIAHASNGAESQLTQIDLTDIDSSGQVVTSRSWATWYSTEHRLWDIEANASTLGTREANGVPAQISWLGFPEDASGGMYRSSGMNLTQTLTHQTPDQTVWKGLPIGQWSSKSLTAEATWSSASPIIENSLVNNAANELSGEVVHHLPGTLVDWIIAYENNVYRPNPKSEMDATRWEPGQKWSPQSSLVHKREMRGFLTRTTATKIQSKKKIVSEDILVLQEQYNPLNLDPAEILQMMTLHEAAGGKVYTGLDHFSLRAFDMTPLLSLDRAVLIGRLAEPQVEWHFNGEARRPTRQHSFVRVLLPILQQRDSSGLRKLPKFEAGRSSNPVDQTTPSNPATAPNEAKSP